MIFSFILEVLLFLKEMIISVKNYEKARIKSADFRYLRHIILHTSYVYHLFHV